MKVLLWSLRRGWFKATCAPGRGGGSIQCLVGHPGNGLGLLTVGRIPFQPHLMLLALNLVELSSPEDQEDLLDVKTTKKAPEVRKVSLSFLLTFLGDPELTAH